MVKIDLSFILNGTQIPADHGYHLYSAISHLIPEIHSDDEMALHTIAGRYTGARLITLDGRSRLTFRIDHEKSGTLAKLAGKQLSIDNYRVYIGVFQSFSLKPSPICYSRLVTIKGFIEPQTFLDAVQRQLGELGVSGNASLIEQSRISKNNKNSTQGTKSPFLRRTLNVQNREIVGFAVKIKNLTDMDSLRLQESGIGGRHRFGCGIFVPVKE